MEQREADLRREMEEREKLHTDTVERLQIQVRGRFSIPNGFPLLSRPFLCLNVSHWLSQMAQLERKEPERKNHPVDSLTSKQFNPRSVALCRCWQGKKKLVTKLFLWIHRRQNNILCLYGMI